jgi:hypothetical protein
LAASGSVITTDPTTNAVIGATVTSKIGYMNVVKYILVPGVKYFVTPESLSGPTVDLKRIMFSEESKMIIENMFREHTSRR